MGIRFDLADGIIRFSTTGEVKFEEGLEVLESAFERARTSGSGGDGRWHLLFDIRESSENRNSGELRQVTSVISSNRSMLSGRCAVIAADPLRYGVARIFGAFMEGLGLEVYVSYSRDEAELWLREGGTS